MEKKNFETRITAAIAPVEAIKRINNVADWWGITFSGNSEKKNDKFVVKMGGDAYFNFTVEEFIPGKRIVWLVIDCNMPWYSDKKEWMNTRLVFELSWKNGLTTLKFTHQGLTPDIECYKDCETGWTHWIGSSLLSYFATGKGEVKDESYTVSVDFDKTPEEVFKHINNIEKWWIRIAGGEQTKFEGNSKKLNDEFVLRHGEVHYSKQKLLEVVPGKKVVWFVTDSELSWIQKNKFEWTGTKMIFDLASREGRTVLTFKHQGLVPEKECYEHSVRFWNMVIKDWLVNYINDSNNKSQELVMKEQDYMKTFSASVTPEQAFKNIVNVGNWWTSSFNGSAEKLNDEFNVTFGKTTVNFKVIESVPYRKLVWLVTDCHLDWLTDKKEWKDTKILWNLTKENKKTKIEMTHVGLVPEMECFKDCEDGWNRYTGESLPKLISSGKGLIFENIKA